MTTEIAVRMTPRVSAFVGDTPRAVEQASRCWAEMMARCTADNSRTFERREWNYMAEAHGGPGTVVWGPRMANLAEAVADRLMRANDEASLGEKWFREEAHTAVMRLFLKVHHLDEPHAWALVTTIEWFWEHKAVIDVGTHEWWTEPYRMAVVEGRAPPLPPREPPDSTARRRDLS